MRKPLKICFFYILFPLLISLAALLVLQLPKYSGVHIYPTRNYNPITVKRDEYGVPTIEAKTYKDTLYGMGYVHAQDRLWTLHFRKLLISGRLSEVFGTEGLLIDRFFLNLGIRRYCERLDMFVDKDSLEHVQAYVDGVNDYISTLKVLPLQFWLLWTDIEPYTTIDAVQNGKLLSFFLAMDFPFEFIFETLENLVGTEIASEIIPHRHERLLWKDAVILNDDELKQSGIYEKFDESYAFNDTSRLTPIPQERRPFDQISCNGEDDQQCYHLNQGPDHANEHLYKVPKGIGEKLGEQVKATKQEYNIGSNAWVIHGNHTTTGMPILASDPHLTNSMPSYWYNLAIIHEENTVSGMSLPGLPGIIFGKSKFAAWGMTNLFADTSDIFKITTKGESYLYEGTWRQLKKFTRKINVRGRSEPEEITIYESHHGIILDHHLSFPFVGMTFEPSANNDTYVLAWTGFTEGNSSMVPVLRLPNCKNTREILDLWKDAVEPSLSFVFATYEGDIGYLALGKIPVRRNVADGTRPRDGSKKENDWLGFVPFEDQPKVINPKKGYIVSANNKISTDNIKWRVSANLMLTARAARIDEMLREYIDNGKKLSVEETKRMQVDTLDILARQVAPVFDRFVREALSHPELVKTLTIPKENILLMLDQLKSWDYRTDADSVPAGIFGVWQTFFLRKILKKTGLTDKDRGSILGSFKIDHFVYGKFLSMEGSPANYNAYWCQGDDHSLSDQPCLSIILKAFEETWIFFNKEVGSDISKWAWGSVHKMEYPHEPFNMTPLKRLFQRSKPGPGNARTVFVAGMQPDKGFDGIWSPNTRMVASLKEGEKSYFIIDTGVSDSVVSPHYDDQMELYYKHGYLEMPEESPKVWKDLLELKFTNK